MADENGISIRFTGKPRTDGMREDVKGEILVPSPPRKLRHQLEEMTNTNPIFKEIK